MINKQNNVTEEKSKQVEELVQNSNANEQESGDEWFSNVGISGIAEVEAGYNDPDEGECSSEIVLPSTKFGIAAVLLIEEDGNNLEVGVTVEF